ncbi:MAG: hypothetical protein EBR22_04280, partial [Cytophagia bacterium]|nr:hypothetical protein [Cytophagia bacterium]
MIKMLWSAFLFCSLQAAPVDSLKPSFHADFPMLSGTDSLLLKQLDEVVITGSREFQRRRESPVAVHVVNRRALQGIQANNALEGLRLIPGLRTETNCQTCHYTQVRMNGLPGGYSQILWNGRPVVSSLLGLYGLDMWPASMVERIEVVRGGGSTMYGSNAVGGTVNIITRTPDQNGFSLGSTYRRVGGGASDGLVDGQLSRLFAEGRGAVQVLYNHRSRQWWDANGDGLSELPKTNADNMSLNAYWRPKVGGRWNLSLQTMREYRYGGSMVFGPVYLASQAEERKTRAKLGHLDYRKTWNQGRSNLVAYTAWQGVQREHYTGIFPDSPSFGESSLRWVQIFNRSNGDANRSSMGGGRKTDEYNGRYGVPERSGYRQHSGLPILGGSKYLRLGTICSNRVVPPCSMALAEWFADGHPFDVKTTGLESSIGLVIQKRKRLAMASGVCLGFSG